MNKRPEIQFRRYLTARDLSKALKDFRAFSSTGDALLDWLESTQIMPPLLRVTWPQTIARRWWSEGRDWASQMIDPVEADTPRLGAANELKIAMSRSGMRDDIGRGHPFDDPEADWSQFIARDDAIVFQPREDRRMSVANEQYPELRDGSNVEDFYSSWQILVGLEASQMGLFINANLLDRDTFHRAMMPGDGGLPDGPTSLSFGPVHSIRALQDHRRTLDAVVWGVEEGNIAFFQASRGLGGGRIRLDEDRAQVYRDGRITVARQAMQRFGVTTDDVIALCNFLADRYFHWSDEGRPYFADAYKVFLASSVRLLQLAQDMSFDEIAEAVGHDGWRYPKLRMIWPDWVKDQRERLEFTLRSSLQADGPGRVSPEELTAFTAFLAEERLEGLFLRLESFEAHALTGKSSSPIEGMRGDIQGLAVDIEHALRAMGATGEQLYSLFLSAWEGTDVEAIMRRYQQLARNGRMTNDWPTLVRRIDEVAAEGPTGAVAADLLLAHRIRGAVHQQLPEEDQWAMEGLFVRLLKAAAMTHAHLIRAQAAARVEEEVRA